MKEITIRVPDDMAQLLVEWVKHIPEMEIVCHEESTDYGLGDMDRRMALALEVLKQNKTIRYLYDYTWIMMAINEGHVSDYDTTLMSLLNIYHIIARCQHTDIFQLR